MTPAESYQATLVPAVFEPWALRVLDHAWPAHGQHALDVACGTGTGARELAPLVGRAGRVVGIDIDAAMLEVARATSLARSDSAEIEWQRASADRMPFPDAEFDFVLCLEGIQFFPQRVRALRRAFVREHPEADWLAGEIAERSFGLLLHGRAAGVAALYRASGSEIDPRPLAEHLLSKGWRLALPASVRLDAPVVFRAWAPGDRLAPDAVGMAAPLAGSPELKPDVIVCPLIAFDRAGGRVGQGGGYYDRTIAALRAAGHAPAIVGLAFSVQEVDHAPMESHDQRLDAILTEKEFIPVRKDL